MSIDDAVFVLVLRRYVFARARWGEQVIQSAALQIVELAREMGLAPTPQLAFVGFHVFGTAIRSINRDALVGAIRIVRKHNRASVVHALYARFAHLTVGNWSDYALLHSKRRTDNDL